VSTRPRKSFWILVRSTQARAAFEWETGKAERLFDNLRSSLCRKFQRISLFGNLAPKRWRQERILVNQRRRHKSRRFFFPAAVWSRRCRTTSGTSGRRNWRFAPASALPIKYRGVWRGSASPPDNVHFFSPGLITGTRCGQLILSLPFSRPSRKAISSVPNKSAPYLVLGMMPLGEYYVLKPDSVLIQDGFSFADTSTKTDR